MKILKMKANFGKLEQAVLELHDGVNILEMPNEGGKSTWCGFIRAMLYGIPTRERDTKGALAEKNRYQPWSGTPMEGEMEILWNQRRILLRRGPKGQTPFGLFSATDAITGDPIQELAQDNWGEVLIGLGKEAFLRTAFVGQSGVQIDGDPELEKRIASLVSSGEEDVSYTATEKTLRGWLNRRKHNKTGLIPALEGQLEELEIKLSNMGRNHGQLAQFQDEWDQLEHRRKELEAESKGHKMRRAWAKHQQYLLAEQQYRKEKARLDELSQLTGVLPSQDALRQGANEMVHYELLAKQEKMAEKALAELQAELGELTQPVNPPTETWEKAQSDYQTVLKKGAPVVLWMALLLLGGITCGYFGYFSQWLYVGAGGAVALIGLVALIMNRRNQRIKQEIFQVYQVSDAGGILRWLEQSRREVATKQASFVKVSRARDDLQQLVLQKQECWDNLLAFVHTFEPEASSVMGIKVSLERGTNLGNELVLVREKVAYALSVLNSLEPVPPEDIPEVEPPALGGSAVEVEGLLSAVRGELSRVSTQLAMAKGQGSALGDMSELENQCQQLQDTCNRRKEEYDAIKVAMDVLGEANQQLQNRFSPDLNRLSSEIFATMTGSKYEGVSLTREFEANVQEVGQILPRRSLSLSGGTVDQLYLSVRLAVCQMALPQGGSFLVLDDALSDFDDQRMALALDYLDGTGQQVLLFTCQSRETNYWTNKP